MEHFIWLNCSDHLAKSGSRVWNEGRGDQGIDSPTKNNYNPSLWFIRKHPLKPRILQKWDFGGTKKYFSDSIPPIKNA
jgi:hypothetical protein